MYAFQNCRKHSKGSHWSTWNWCTNDVYSWVPNNHIIMYIYFCFLGNVPLYTALFGPVRLLFSGISTLYEPYLGLYNIIKKKNFPLKFSCYLLLLMIKSNFSNQYPSININCHTFRSLFKASSAFLADCHQLELE